MKLYNISLNNLRRRKSKMAFLVIGLTIAVSTVVTLVTITRIMNADLASKLDEYGANIVITPKSEDLSLSYGGMSISSVSLNVQQLHMSDVEQIRSIKNSDNIKIIAPKLLSATNIQQRNVLVVGVDFPQELLLKKWWKLRGDAPTRKQEALLGAEARKKLHLTHGQSFQVNGETFIVKSVLEPTGSQDDGIVFINLEEAQRLFGKPNQLSLIEVAALCYDCPIEEIVRQASDKLPNAKVMAIRQTIESKMEAMHRFEQFSYGISIVVLLVAALIVITNMTASVNERTREIGVFRAIGYRQSHVLKIILTEAFITSLFAGVCGYLIGWGASNIVAPILTMDNSVSSALNYPLLGLSVFLAISVGIVASIFPAYKASRLDPTVALKSL